MIFSLYFFKRHAWIFSCYVFLISSLFSESISPVSISIDPIDNTAYRLDSTFPSVQCDIHIFDIRINGDLGLPLSSYIFDLDESPVYLNDSLRTRSAFHFIKGDYGFRDLSVKTESLTLNRGTITAFAHTRSYSGVNGFIGEGSLMQNYLLNYRNNFKSSKFSITTAYHNEDMDLPINNSSYSTKINESYLSGITFSHQTKFGKFKYFSDLQVSESKIENVEHEDWIYTQQAVFKFDIMSPLTPFIGWTESEGDEYIYRLGFNWKDSLSLVSLNSIYINNPQFEFTLSKKFSKGYIYLQRKILDDYADTTNTFMLNSFTFSVKNDSFNFQLIPSIITSDSFLFNSYRWSAAYDGNTVRLNVFGCFYDENDIGLRHVINTDFQINFPYFEKYTPFLKAEYNNYHFEESINSDLLTASTLTELHFSDMSQQVHSLHFEFGINLESFDISYHYRNMLGEDGRFTSNYEQVPIHKYLKVAWKFRN